MITVNSLSGGQTSAYVAAHHPADYDIFSLVRTSDTRCKYPDETLRKRVEDKLQMPFVGTLEDDMIIHTMFDLEQFIGREITWVSGVTFDELIVNKGKYLPNKQARYCTTELKTIPIATHLYNEGLSPVRMRFGYRANETNRRDNMLAKTNDKGIVEAKIIIGKWDEGRNKGQNKWKVIEYQKPEFPLIKDNIFKDNIVSFWRGKGVRFAYMNNCIGCWWRGPMLLSHMNERDPEKFDWFVNQETIGKGTFRSDVTYAEVKKYKTQGMLFSDEDFSECDSGYCGV